MLPLYEAKMIHHFDSRFSTYNGATQAQINKGTLPRLTHSQHDDPLCVPIPRYWVQEADTLDVQKSKPEKPSYDHGVRFKLEAQQWQRSWLLGWRDVCRSADERTMICAALPRTAVGHKLPLCFPTECPELLVATWSSFIFDYVARQKIAGTSMAFFVLKQLPMLPPSAYQSPAPWLGQAAPAEWIRQRVLELTFTAWDMQAFAQDLGDEEAPFRWDEERRFAMRAELDAALFRLYGVDRDDLGYIMDSFRAFQNNDRARFDRTKELILNVYDAMAEAIRTGVPYQTILDPPPGQGPRHG